MDNDRIVIIVGSGRVPDKGDERKGMERDTMIRPGSVVVLVHCVYSSRLRLLLLPRRNTDLLYGKGTQGVECEHIFSYNSHIYISIITHPILWPVLLTFYL